MSDNNVRAAIISLGFVLSVSVHAQAPIAVELESHHKPVFTDQTLRILEVVVPEGDATLDHIHQYDIATVCIECAATQTRAPGEAWGENRFREAGGVLVAEYAGKPAAHAVRNIGEGFYRLVGIENLRLAEWATAAPPDGPAAATLRQETRAFRIHDVRLDPGKGTEAHTHRLPTVAVLVAGDSMIANDTGGGARRMTRPGEWQLVPAGRSHTVSAPYGVAVHLVELEVR